MSSQQGKDTALAYLKVVIHLLNENMDELELGRPLRLEDLDHLNSQQMLKIVTFLLRDVVGDKPTFKPTALTDFNRFGVGNVSYDCGIDHVYHAVKQIFPEDSDLFHYSVLLLPASNPKRTKAVISYIMSFVLMCDNLEERFSACFNEVIKENEEKVAICAEVDDLKDKISEKIQERETEKGRLPTLQKELQNLEDNIRKQQNVLAKLNADLGKHKTVYESKEMETKNLELELERLSTERCIAEQQIVSNPSEIRSENVSIKTQLESETKGRQTIGRELEKCAKDCDVFESLIQRAHHVIESIESAVALMENTKSKIEFYTKTGNEMMITKIELQKQELLKQKLIEQHTEEVSEINKRTNEHDHKIEELHNEMSKIKGQIQQTKNQTNAALNGNNEISHAIEVIGQEIEKLTKDTVKCVRDVTEVIPKLRNDKEAEAVKALQRVVEKFSYYPLLKGAKRVKKNQNDLSNEK